MHSTISQLKWTSFLLSTVMLLSIGLFAWPETTEARDVELSLSSAINVAGRQRMLTQRIMKFYSMVGLNAKKEVSANNMQAAVDLFDYQLLQLQHIKGIDKAVIQRHTQPIQTEWIAVKKELVATPSLEHANSLQRQLDKLLNLSNAFVVALQKSSTSQTGTLVNTAGRQRMLSQRIASFYLLETWGLRSGDITQKRNQAISDFEKAQQQLSSDKDSGVKIAKLLQKVATEWDVFTSRETIQQPVMVSSSSDRILWLMNSVTGLYAANTVNAK